MSRFYESPHQLEPYVLTDLGDVEPLIEALLEAGNRLKAGAAPYTAAFIQKMHLVYCKSLASETLVPGHWREQNVQVSRHIPPEAARIVLQALAFPLRAIGTFFPNLFPAGSLEA